MTVTEAVTASGITPSADYKGIENTDDFVLAICTEASKKDAVKDWTVCADHVREHSGALNASTSDNTYIRTGPVTTKGSVQRTLAINGDRCKGDAFQDFILGHEMIYGFGQSVILPYVIGKSVSRVSSLYFSSMANASGRSFTLALCSFFFLRYFSHNAPLSSVYKFSSVMETTSAYETPVKR